MKGKKVLSLFLSLVMMLSVCVVAFNTTKLEADAATAGTYDVQVVIHVTDTMYCKGTQNVRLYTKGSNGTASQSDNGKQDFSTYNDSTTTKSWSNVGFPSQVNCYCAGSSLISASVKYYIQVYVKPYNTGSYTEVYKSGTKSHSSNWKSKVGSFTDSFSVTTNYPYASSISLSGGSTTLTAPNYDTSGASYTSAFSATVKDQYGVVIGSPSIAWSKNSISNTTTYVSSTSGDSSKFGVSRFTSASAKQTGTITANATFNSKSCSTSKNITVYPQYKIMWNANGGTLSGTSNQYATNTGTSSTLSYTIPSTFKATRTGYTFKGWNKSSGQSSGTNPGSAISLTAISTTLYAAWQIKTGTATFYDTNIYYDENNVRQTYADKAAKTYLGTNTQNYNVKPSYSGVANLKMTTTQQYTYAFKGWSLNADGSGTLYSNSSLPVITVDSSNNIINPTYYAVYGAVVNNYTLTYKVLSINSDGNRTFVDKTEEIPFGSKAVCIVVDDIQDDTYHYTFSGWTFAKDGSGQLYTGGDDMPVIENDKTIYASYTKEAHDLTIEGNIVKEPTCDTEGTRTMYCSVCNKGVEVAVPTTEHDWCATEPVAATCTEYGREAGRKCNICGVEVLGAKTAKADHITDILFEVPATCTENGLTEGSQCRFCDAIIVRQETIPASHTKEVFDAVASTCSVAGHSNGVYCPVCGEIPTEDDWDTNENITWITEPTVSELKSHTWKLIEKAVAATCTEQGKVKTVQCENCGTYRTENDVTYDGHAIEANGHIWVDATPKAATCYETGLTEGTVCSVCGELGTAEVIPVQEHKQVIVPGKDATCTEDGYTESIYCSECELWIQKAAKIPAAHTLEEIPAVKATCTSTGLTIGYKCTVCNEIIKEQTETPMQNHKLVTEKKVEATCTTAGSTAWQHCRDCDYVEYEAVIIPATGHDMENLILVEYANEQAATCVAEGGYDTQYICPTCGEIVSSVHTTYEIDPEAHKDDDGDRVCDICGGFASTGCDSCDEYYQEESHSFMSIITHIIHCIKHFFESLAAK